MSEKIKVLHVVANMNAGGIENMLMNLFRAIDRDKIQFEFLFHTQEKCFFEDEIIQLGGIIHRIEPLRVNSLATYLKNLDTLFKENNFDIVHSHFSVWTYFVLRMAKKNKIKARIAHSHEAHDSIWDHKIHRVPLIFALKKVINKPVTHRFACGDAAGKWMYGNTEFTIINNAIDTDKFIYNSEISKKIKKELNIENVPVFGHLGRFHPVKNHTFLIDIFESLKEKFPTAKLVLIGDGETRPEIEEKVKNKNLTNDVLFLGLRKDVNKLLQAIDFMLMPSTSEGVPVSLIEAQANGLKIFASDQISKEVDVTGNVYFLPINNGTDSWVKEIIKYSGYKKENVKDKIVAANYDIENNAILIENFYTSLVNKEVN